jgi:uncharacterized damage-inducible protein DinB
MPLNRQAGLRCKAGSELRENSVPTDLATTISRLTKAQDGLLRAADSVPAEAWQTRPGEGRWCAAELVAHLVMVERGVVEKADRVVQHSPRKTPLLKRFHIPMALVSTRVIRRKSPISVDAEMLRDKEEMLAELRNARERTLAFLDETKDLDLGEYYWAHPALGTLNMYEWMRFISAHEIRHTKQMREIAASLPKSV